MGTGDTALGASSGARAPAYFLRPPGSGRRGWRAGGRGAFCQRSDPGQAAGARPLMCRGPYGWVWCQRGEALGYEAGAAICYGKMEREDLSASTEGQL